MAGAAEGDPISAKVVFQPPSGTIPAGYTRDTGAAYSATTGSGWITEASLPSATHVPLDLTKNTRYRAAGGSCTGTFTDVQRSLIHMQVPASTTTH